MKEIIKSLQDSKYFYIIISGMDAKYAYVNQHYANEFKYIHENFAGQPYHITMHPDDRYTCEEVSKKCFANPGQLFPAIIRKHDGEGGYIYTQWEYLAMFDDDGNPEGIFCLGYNITQFVADKQNLEGAMDKIEKNSTLLSEIAFQQAHLIRAPLTNILALTAILNKRTVDDELRSICQMILESALKLDYTVKNIVENINTSEEENEV
ncbi:PAS domain-containing protein [Pedobacter lithocola]|uniref:PAS domain-containing protein n=1 Tax=Pedobacter lithocola TaxID=1908239 RepID=A0ABV8P7K3_9SPHI